MKKLVASLGLLVILTACAQDLPPAPVAVNHNLPPKIAFNVQAINLADRSGLQPANSPYNANHFSPTISEAIKQWASDRLQATGQSGQAILVIKDASLIAQPLPIKQGMDGWFTRQQGVKYVARAEVSMEANGDQGFAMADAVASRSITLPEEPTAIEKQDAYYSLLNGLMKDLGQNLESSIQSHMGAFIVTSPAFGATAVPTGMATQPVATGFDDNAPIVIQSPAGMAQPMAAFVPQQQAISPAPAVSQMPEPLVPATTAQAVTAAPVSAATPQAPVFGTTSFPAVPDLASSPTSFGMKTAAPPAPAPVMAPQNCVAPGTPTGNAISIPLSGSVAP